MKTFLQALLSHFFMSVTTTRIYTMPNGQPVYREHVGNVTKRVYFKGRMEIDGDGTGGSHGDKDYQPTTSLKHHGQFLDSDADKYVVVYPQIIDAVPEIVLGCQSRVTRISSGHSVDTVTGDVGPHDGRGEASIATAKAHGVASSPVNGGEEAVSFLYEFWPGQPALVDDVVYQLQKF